MMSVAAAPDKRALRRARTQACPPRSPELSFGGADCLPARQYRALELGQDELLDLRGVVAVHEDLDPGLVLVDRANGDEIDVGTLRVLAQDRILDGIEARLGCIVCVDRCGVDIVERARRLCRVDLD